MADPGQVERFRSAIANRLGLHFEEAKLGFLAEVLQRRISALRLSSADYLSAVEAGPDRRERSALAAELTVGETYFFRNIEQFRAFSEVALPQCMRARSAEKRLRILSAGCASGEEAYSAAILLRQFPGDPEWDASILAVDINPAMIEAANRLQYTAWSLRQTPEDVLRQWMHPAGRGVFALDSSLTRNVTFEVRNLVENDDELWRAGFYDVVFCRNVMMYLTPEAAGNLIRCIAHSLRDGGYLFLGHAETLRGISQDFHLCESHDTFYYRRKDGPCGARAAAVPKAAPVSSGRKPDDAWMDAIRTASERIRALSDGPSGMETPAAAPPSPERSPWDLARPLELLRKEHFAEAIDLVQRLPPESSADPDVLLLRAALLAHGGRFSDSREVCRRLLDIDELNAGAHYVLALCCEAAGEAGEAAAHDRAAIHLDPGFAMPHLHLGLLSRRKGENDAARTELRRAIDLLQREEAARLLFFGGGFGRDALAALCRSELNACGGES